MSVVVDKLEKVVAKEKPTTLLKCGEDAGQVMIADDVVAMIAALAAGEVEGVSSIGNEYTTELMNRVGMKDQSKGVKVEIANGIVKIAMNVTMEYGYPIPSTSTLVQNKVKNAVETMTGMTVRDVNVRISGIKVANK